MAAKKVARKAATRTVKVAKKVGKKVIKHPITKAAAAKFGSSSYRQDLKKPNIGWSKINILEENKIIKHDLSSKEFYFLHNFYIKKNKSSVAILNSNISAVINQDNIYGTQFHPENSHEQGVELLKNFTNI